LPLPHPALAADSALPGAGNSLDSAAWSPVGFPVADSQYVSAAGRPTELHYFMLHRELDGHALSAAGRPTGLHYFGPDISSFPDKTITKHKTDFITATLKTLLSFLSI
jgi:hypothetical protein